MAKDKLTNAETVENKEKKEKKEKKRKHSEVEAPAEVSAVSERKKEKKDKKRKSTDADGDAIMATSPGAEVSIIKDEDSDDKKAVQKVEVPLAALVPFANPLCDEKAQKKVLKSVKKGTPHTPPKPAHTQLTSPTNSGKTQSPQTRRQRMRESAAQIAPRNPHHPLLQPHRRKPPRRHRRPGRRY